MWRTREENANAEKCKHCKQIEYFETFSSHFQCIAITMCCFFCCRSVSVPLGLNVWIENFGIVVENNLMNKIAQKYQLFLFDFHSNRIRSEPFFSIPTNSFPTRSSSLWQILNKTAVEPFLTNAKSALGPIRN